MNINYIKECERNINNLCNIIYFSNNFIKKKNNNILISVFDNFKIFNINKNIISKINFENSIDKYIKKILKINNSLIVGDYIFDKLINKKEKINFFELEIYFYNIKNIQFKKNIKKILKILNMNDIKIYETKNNILISTKLSYNIKINLIKNKSIFGILKKKNLFNKFIYDGKNVFTDLLGHNLIINNFNNININKFDLIKYRNFLKKYFIDISSFDNYADINYIYSNKLIDNINFYKVNNKLENILDISYDKICSVNNIKFRKINNNYININKLLSILKNDNLKNLKIFIKNNLNIIYTKIHNLNLIHYTCKYNSKNILTYILNIDNNLINQIDNNYNIPPLFFCVICNNFEIFKILLNDKNLDNKIKWIIGNKKKIIYNIIDLCVVLNRENFIKIIINNNIEIELSSYSKCIEFDNFEMLKMLEIKDINILNKTNNKEESLLSKSIRKINENVEQRKIIIYLIEKGINLDYKNNIQPLNQIVELNDIPLLNFFINSGANINCLDKNNMNCLDIINKQRNELLKKIHEEKYKLNFDIFKNKIIKKYGFLKKELFKNNYLSNDIIYLKKKLDKLNKINDLILENKGIYNNKINFIINDNDHKIIFKNEKNIKKEEILNLFENIFIKDIISIRKFINNNKNILYVNIELYHTNRTIFHLIVENNLKDILIDFINLTIEQCNSGLYHNSINNKNLDDLYKLNYDNKKFKNKNSFLIYLFLINKILLSKSNNFNIIETCIINKSYECLDFFFNNNDIIPKYLIDDYFYNISNILLTIEYNELGIFILIFKKIKNKITNKKKILFKIIENRSIKILYYLNENYCNFFDLEIKDDQNNNLFHYLFNYKYLNTKYIFYIFKYLYEKIPHFLYLTNKNDISPLHKLTKLENMKILKIIIDLNVDLYEYDNLGYNIMHHSIINNNISFIDYFINIYPNLLITKTKFEKRNSLILSVIKNNLLIFNKLIKINLINETDLYGNNIYYYISKYSRLDFLKNNRNNNFKNNFNITEKDLILEKLLYSLYINSNINKALQFYNFINPKKKYKLKILNKSNIEKLKNKIIYKYYIKDSNNSKYIIK